MRRKFSLNLHKVVKETNLNTQFKNVFKRLYYLNLAPHKHNISTSESHKLLIEN